jgi:hypothetical protein
MLQVYMAQLVALDILLGKFRQAMVLLQTQHKHPCCCHLLKHIILVHMTRQEEANGEIQMQTKCLFMKEQIPVS